jgi:ABC-2 type transport system permease protein
MNPRGSDGGLSPARAVYLVSRREFTTRVRGKVFVVGTILTVGLLAVYAILQITVFDKINTTTTYNLGFTQQTAPLTTTVDGVASLQGFRVKATDVADEARGEALVRSGTLDALIAGTAAAPEVVVRTKLGDGLRSALDSVVRQEALDRELSAGGLDPQAVASAVDRATFQVDVLQPPKPNALEQPIVGAVLAFLLYIFLTIYGTVIAQGVVTEKASRVVEILLSTLRPGQLLLGKVTGIGLVSVLQFAIIAGAGLALTVPTHVLALPAAAIGSVLVGVMWFVLGFALYSMMLAAGASLVSRVEEVSAATLPVTLVIVLAWLLAYVVFIPEISAATDGTTIPAGVENLGTIASLIPFFSPVLMPIRVAAGDAPLWQGVLAVALSLLTIAGVTWTAARIYSNSVLRFGARVRFAGALRRSA